jgi:hypothetical protein
MNRLRLVPPVIALGLIATVGAAWADQSPFAGRWRWNRTQSTVQPNEPLPKDIVTEIASADPSRIRWSVTIVDPTDKRHVQTFDAPPDGQPHPVQGSSDGTTAAFTLGGGTLQAVFKNPAGQTDSVACTLTQDHRQMTCKGSVAGDKGQAENYVDVYDRF